LPLTELSSRSSCSIPYLWMMELRREKCSSQKHHRTYQGLQTFWQTLLSFYFTCFVEMVSRSIANRRAQWAKNEERNAMLCRPWMPRNLGHVAKSSTNSFITLSKLL
jgi:hypothetical protein